MSAKFSVKKPMTIFVAVILVLILGVVSFTEMTPDLLPSINLPYALVMTTYPGASPEEVETTVTKPVEQSMASLNHLDEIRSVSSENMSMVILSFQDDTNMDAMTVDIREKLDQVSAMWSDSIGSPIIMKLNPDMLPIVVAAVDSEDMDQEELTQYVKDTVVPALEGVDGVASVTASGMLEKQISVVIRQDLVDQVNGKMLNSVEDSLEEAEAALNDASEQIENGKTELENQSSQMQSGMVQGEQALSEARLQIVTAEVALDSAEKELNQKEQEALAQGGYASLDDMEQKLTESLEGINTLLSQEETLRSSLAQTESGLAGIESGLEAAAQGKEGLNAALEAWNALILQGAIDEQGNLLLPEGTPGREEIAAKVEALKPVMAGYDAQMEALTTQETELTAQKTQLEGAKGQLEETLTRIDTIKTEKTVETLQSALEGVTALKNGKSQIAQQRTKLAEGKQTIIDQSVALGMTRYEAEAKLADAKSQLTAGEKELEEQKKTFDASKEAAIKQADLSGKLTVDMISQILSAQNFSMPAGYASEDGTAWLVRVGNKVEDLEELKDLILFDTGMEGMDPIRLSDVADVMFTDNSADLYAKINGKNGIMLSMEKQPTYATADVADHIAEKMDQLSAQKAGISFTVLSNQGDYIDLVVNSVLKNLLYGAILAIAVLLIFLRDWRPTVIIACSIPVSVIAAIVLMYFSGVTINMISLSGLAVGVGMLVDNSVVVIENIYRLRKLGYSAVRAAVNGCTQVAGAIIASTLTTVSVFLPIVFIKGLTRELFTDMALTIGYSLLASLAVAMTLVPAMASGMLKRRVSEKESRFAQRVQSGYRKAVGACLRHRALVMIGAVVLLVVSIAASVSRGAAFMPSMDSTQLTASLTMPEGSTQDETKEMADTVSERIGTIEGVDTVGAMMGGGGMLSSMQQSSDSISFYVILNEDKKISSQQIASRIEELCADLPCEVTANGSAMDISMLSGSGVSIRLEGQDLDQLKEAARQVAAKLETVEGLTEVSDGVQNPDPELRIVIDKDKAMAKGLTVAQTYLELQKALRSEQNATTLSEGSSSWSVMVSEEALTDMTCDEVRNFEFTVTGMDGEEKTVRLSDIAKITETESLSSIQRQDQKRYLTVSAMTADGYNISKVSTKAREAVDAMTLPDGVKVVYEGENENIQEAMGQVIKMLLLALAFIYLIMVAQFQSLLSPFIVMFTIPLAFTGGFLGLFLSGKEVSVIAMIGFVMLSGVVVNNGIVLVDYMNQLRRDGMEKREAVIEAGAVRMRPVLMTAITTILGLVTMAAGVGIGAEMMQPVAIVTTCGLFYATLMTLFVIPVMYDALNRKKIRVIKEEEMEAVDESDL